MQRTANQNRGGDDSTNDWQSVSAEVLCLEME